MNNTRSAIHLFTHSGSSTRSSMRSCTYPPLTRRPTTRNKDRGKHPLLIGPNTYEWRKQSRANETGHEQESDGLFREAVLLAIKRVNIWPLKPVRTYTIPMSTPLVPSSALAILQRLGRTHNDCIDGQVLSHQ